MEKVAWSPLSNTDVILPKRAEFQHLKEYMIQNVPQTDKTMAESGGNHVGGKVASEAKVSGKSGGGGVIDAKVKIDLWDLAPLQSSLGSSNKETDGERWLTDLQP